MADRIAPYLAATYASGDHPALSSQGEEWSRTRPLAGVRIVDATPVWRNTLAKYRPLLLAGADLTVCLTGDIPHDPAVARLLADWGVPVLTGPPPGVRYDVVVDCAAALRAVPSRYGYCELTRSGAEPYADCDRPVFLVDAGVIKRIETELGTGDGFVRALVQLGHDRFGGRRVVVFGAGKVGRGVAAQCLARGARVTVVDAAPPADPPPGCTLLSAADVPAVRRAINAAWCVVTATGVRDAVAPYAADLVAAPALLANMGAADEFGPAIPAARVLHSKKPVNFLLTEPTRLRYLDPVFALSNAGVVALLRGGLAPGVNAPPRHLEHHILRSVADGPLGAELRNSITFRDILSTFR